MDAAIVTGASSGMGREVVLQLSQRRDPPKEIWAVARSEERLRELAREASCPVRVVSADLTKQDDIECVQKLLETEKPRVSFLANCAGFAKFGEFGAIREQDIVAMIQVDVQAVVQMTDITVPYMPPGSSVLEWASIAAFQPLPGLNVYAACKAFVLSYSRALNVELKPRGVSVTAVCPGWTNTPFLTTAEKNASSDAVSKFAFTSEPQDVVRKAIKDGLAHKAISVYGLPAKLERFFAKILPVSWIMAIWNKTRH